MRLRALTAAMLGLAGVLLFSAPAYAHSYLESSTPNPDQTLTTLPEQFSVSMNESLLDLSGDGAGFGMLIRDSAGLYYGDGCFTISGTTLSTAAALGAAGSYTLIYQVVSADGHSVSDELPFAWAPKDGFTPALGAENAPGCGGEAAVAPLPTGATAPADNGISSDVLWIGGGILVVLIAVGATLIAVKPKKQE